MKRWSETLSNISTRADHAWAFRWSCALVDLCSSLEKNSLTAALWRRTWGFWWMRGLKRGCKKDGVRLLSSDQYQVRRHWAQMRAQKIPSELHKVLLCCEHDVTLAQGCPESLRGFLLGHLWKQPRCGTVHPAQGGLAGAGLGPEGSEVSAKKPQPFCDSVINWFHQLLNSTSNSFFIPSTQRLVRIRFWIFTLLFLFIFPLFNLLLDYYLLLVIILVSGESCIWS